MKHWPRSRRRRDNMCCFVALLAYVVFSKGGANAQILHNPVKYGKAQQVEAAARDVLSGAVFEKELRNADLIAETQIDSQLETVRSEYLSDIDGLTTWHDVRRLLDRAEKDLERASGLNQIDAKRLVREIEERQSTIQEQIEEGIRSREHQSDQDSIFTSVFDYLDRGEALLAFAKSLGERTTPNIEALSHLKATIETIASLYDSWSQERVGESQIQAWLGDLQTPSDAVEVELLGLEAQYLTRLGMIAARRALAAGESLKLVQEARRDLSNAEVDDDQQIMKTIESAVAEIRSNGDSAARDKLFFQLHGLHTAAALAVRAKLPRRLGALRETQEALRHAIQQDAALARSYEQLLLTSSQRLSLNYRGGIKPGQIAALFYHVLGLASVSVIAAQ